MKIVVSLILMFVCAGLNAQELGIDSSALVDSLSMTDSMGLAGASQEKTFKELFINYTGFSLWMIISLCVCYIYYKEWKRKHKCVGLSEMEALRSSGGNYPPPEEANEKCIELCSEILSRPYMDTDLGYTVLMTRKDCEDAFDVVAKCRELAPTSPEAIQMLNDVGTLANTTQKRVLITHMFSRYNPLSLGEKVLYIFVFLTLCLFIFGPMVLGGEGLQVVFACTDLFLTLILPLWICFSTPNYLADKTYYSKYLLVGRILAALTAAIFKGGLIDFANGKGIERVHIKWSDGSHSTETDTSMWTGRLFLSIVLSLFGLYFLYVLTPVFLIIAIFRNYVFYK